MGIMAKKMETTVQGYLGLEFRVQGLGSRGPCWRPKNCLEKQPSAAMKSRGLRPVLGNPAPKKGSACMRNREKCNDLHYFCFGPLAPSSWPRRTCWHRSQRQYRSLRRLGSKRFFGYLGRKEWKRKWKLLYWVIYMDYRVYRGVI